jgi:hypothetical protein
MILDALLELADGQSGTTSTASTNVIDTLAGGDAYAGGMAGLFFITRIDTAFTATGLAVNASFQLQTSSSESFTPDTTITLCQSGEFPAAQLTAKKIIALPIPEGARRYIRGYKEVENDTAGSNVFSAGAWDMYIAKDAPITRRLA